MNYLLTLKYDGSAYHGWQRQENAITVQECVEAAIEKLFREKVSVTGCSRTDTGVHANCFKCNFRVQKEIALEKIVSGMNFFLPDDIAVFDCEIVGDEFNARFDCQSKEYIYKIYNGRVRDPFSLNKAYFHKYPLDAVLMDEQAKDFIGTFDFSAFCAAGATAINSSTQMPIIAGAFVFLLSDGFLSIISSSLSLKFFTSLLNKTPY